MTAAIILSAVLGGVIAAVLSCVPGFHVYNLMALLVAGLWTLGPPGGTLASPEIAISLTAAMIAGYSMLNTVPSILLAAPDESMLFTVLPGQKYLMAGRGYEGTIITARGSMAGLVIVLAAGPFLPRLLPVIHIVLQPHLHWMLWCVICFMLMSEWPTEGRLGQGGRPKLATAWKPLGAGIATFLFSGFLGFMLFYRSPIPVEASFQNLMPAFVGLFTLPWLILNLVTGVTPPAQQMTCRGTMDRRTIFRGAVAGGAGGAFAAFMPAVTGGVGGFLAGHATAMRDERTFLVSQGTSKVVYYVGGFLLFLVPGFARIRGGGARLLSGLYAPAGDNAYYIALAAVAIGGAVAYMLVPPLTRGVILLIGRLGYRRISCASLIAVAGLVMAMTGVYGIFVAVVGAAIGLIPPLFGSRRMNCLGVILLPLACNASGIGHSIAGMLGLL